MQGRTGSYNVPRRAHEAQGRTGSYDGSRRAHEPHQEKRTDFLTDVFSSFINLTRYAENPIWAPGRTQDPNNRDRLFKSSWRQFGLLSCLDDETMQQCLSCMKVRRCCDCVLIVMHIFVLQSMTV